MSDGEEVNIFAVIHVKEGSMDRVKELLKNLCKDVHGEENYTLRYMATERIDGGGNDVCMFETYKDQSGSEKHTKTDHFTNFFATFQQENLGTGPPYIATTKSFAGFDLDHKLA